MPIFAAARTRRATDAARSRRTSSAVLSRVGLLTCALMGLLWPQMSLAQNGAGADIKPRILLVFDTSGSMGFDLVSDQSTGGDNSIDYPGNGGTSRLSVAKQVMTEIVTTTSEVEFGLMRYPQVEGAGINDGTGRAAFTIYTGLPQRPLNYVGTCTGQLRRDNPDTAYALLEPFNRNNENSILRWFDAAEAWPVDRELRAEGPTPIAESLRLGEAYLRSEVLAADPDLRCRENFMVLLTDGAESCVGGNQQQILLERTLALRQMDVLQGGEQVRKSVRVFVVAFAVERVQLGLLDTVARIGGTAVNAQGQLDLVNGRAYQANDLAGLRSAFARILAEAIPSERCNALDDDCDGRIDEGTLNACGQCGPTPGEICNGRDDDCDGGTDEGVSNVCGGCGPVPAEACNDIDDDCDGLVDEAVLNACGGCADVRDEVCNGLDDDCDGVIDNTPGTRDPMARGCSTDVGECVAGFERCTQARWGVCDGILPIDEGCDGLDNDCDGFSDEATRPCGPSVDIGNVGQCRVGAQACDFDACQANPEGCDEGGWRVECTGAAGPAEEICDGLDNDCDGLGDEGLFNACGICGMAPPEVCNGVDDNCDGRIDENARCPRGYQCWLGECATNCDVSGECAPGLNCVRGWGETRLCHPDACAGVDCPEGRVCDSVVKACVDPCLGISCGEGEACENAECVPATCRHVGCPEGQRCRGETCEPDPCAGTDCGPEQFCREGACVDACIGQRCGAGLACQDGDCVADPCGGRCVRGQRCDPADGACVEDECARVECPAGTACQAGVCTADSPCAVIECPAGTACVGDSCTDGLPGVEPNPFANTGDAGMTPFPDQGVFPDFGPTIDLGAGGVGGANPDAGAGGEGGEGGGANADAGDPPLVGGGGEGCSCDVSSEGHPASPAWALLALLGLVRRRRRR
jgi:MYXO-CTERM domain-containing protein